MFTQNKYTKWYYLIIVAAQGRILPDNIYTEHHHIVPNSLGGKNTPDNMVYLTGREHFICHWLLTKMTSGRHYEKMIYALNGMKRISKKSLQKRYNTKITSRVFANLKEEFSRIHSNRVVTEETKQKIGEASVGRRPMLGKKHTEETKMKISQKKIGKPLPKSEETKIKMSAAQNKLKNGNNLHVGDKNPMFGKLHSNEAKQKMSLAKKGKPSHNKGKPMSDEAKLKLSLAAKARYDSKQTKEDINA